MNDNEDGGMKEVKQRIEALETRVAKLERAILKGGKRIVDKSLSIKEFLLEKNPKGDVNKTLAVGFFLEKYGGLSSFTVGDLRGGFVQAREQVPLNLNDMVNKNIEKGHMMGTPEGKDGKKSWVLTNKGEKLVQGNFSEAT